MGLKAGLQLLQQTGKAVANYADDAARLFVKNGDDAVGVFCRKPVAVNSTKLKALRFAPETIGDTFKMARNNSLEEIKKGIIAYAPLKKQKELIQRFDDFITSEPDLEVIEKMFSASKKEFNSLSAEKVLVCFNKYFKNLKILRDNNPADYELMVKGGFFDLVEQGKISLQNFDTDFSKARVSRALLEDLRKVVNKESFITKIDDLSFDEIKKIVKDGEVYSKNGRLFTYNHGLEHEIQMSEEKLLELFPPVLRHVSNQGAICNCWVVGKLDNMISTQSGISGMFSLFRQSGDDIYIKFRNSDKEILFPAGKVLQTQSGKQMTTVPGLAMLEQALAVHLGGVYSAGKVTSINNFSKNPDGLMNLLLGSNKRALMMRKKANNGEMLNVITGEHIDYIVKANPYSSYRADNTISFWEKLCLSLGIKSKKTANINKNLMTKIIDSQANEQNLKIGVGFIDDTPYEYRDLYNLVPDHCLTIKSLEDNICWISNPWFNWIEKGVDKEILLKYAKGLDVPMKW